jgi:polyphosphate glucokinase
MSKNNNHPITLAFDIGGTGLKASVISAKGEMLHKRERIPTTYPCPPEKMLDDLLKLTKNLPDYDRISMGFPGMVRDGKVLTAPHFITVSGPGSEVSAELKNKWENFDMQEALYKKFNKPAKVANDADVAGSAVISGKGLEVVITLGTGFGSAYFYKGKLMPHLEMAHIPFRKGETYNEQLGNDALKSAGKDKWESRVHKAIEVLSVLFNYDLLYIGGGNASNLNKEKLPENVKLISNDAGILGGVMLWERQD